MKYGIFSDIHSNLPALEQVVQAMKRAGVERFVCLGDLVGYCAQPDECVQMVSDLAHLCVLGNHDSVALKREPSLLFNQFARLAIEWTQKVLSPSSLEYMKSLPYIVEENDCTFVHASPKSPADWFYVSSLDEALDAFEFFGTKFCFVGHTHNPVIVTLGDSGVPNVIEDDHFRLLGDERLLVNVGSVGQPRDRDARASWCLFDTESQEISIRRESYDISHTQQIMTDHAFPVFLIQRLADGR